MTLLTPLTWLFSQWKKLLGRFVHSSESDAITEGELITMVSEAENDGELTDRDVYKRQLQEHRHHPDLQPRQ